MTHKDSCPHCAKSSDSSGFSSGLLLGLILGGAGGYLLSTKRGQELLNNLKEGAGDKLKEFADNPVVADKLAELESIMTEARATIGETSESAREKIHQAATQVARATEDEKPKRNLFRRRGTPLK